MSMLGWWLWSDSTSIENASSQIIAFFARNNQWVGPRLLLHVSASGQIIHTSDTWNAIFALQVPRIAYLSYGEFRDVKNVAITYS